jgi:hypothetical protein
LERRNDLLVRGRRDGLVRIAARRDARRPRVPAGSACPHYDDENRRRPVYRHLVTDGFPPGLALDAAAAARFEGTKLAEVVASAPVSRGYRVGPDGETPLETRALVV